MLTVYVLPRALRLRLFAYIGNCSSPVQRSLDIWNRSYAHLLYCYSYDRIGQDFLVFHLANQFISQILVVWILDSVYSL